MAVELRKFAVTTPAGTAVANPLVTDISFPTRIVERIEVRVPPGPRGNLGFRFASGGVQMIPLQMGSWIITDDDRLEWDLVRQIDSGAWQMVSYNTGRYPHTIEVRFLLGLTQDVAAAGVGAPIAVGELAPGGAPFSVTVLPPPELPAPPVLALPAPVPLPVLPGLPALPALPGGHTMASELTVAKDRAGVILAAFAQDDQGHLVMFTPPGVIGSGKWAVVDVTATVTARGATAPTLA